MNEISEPVPNYRTRLEVLFARDARVAVILRRGPKRHFNLLTWDLETDTITSGQWMKGIVRLCDLSPSGKKLLYWAAQYHANAPAVSRGATGQQSGQYDPVLSISSAKKKRPGRKVPRYMGGGKPKKKRVAPIRENQGVWTAVSTPPYFSALAIWPCFGHWTGGGVFGSEWDLKLFEDREGITPIANVAVPSKMRINPILSNGFLEQPLIDCAYNPGRDKNDASVEVANALREAGVKWVDWVNTRAGDDLLFACDGCVYRLNDWLGIPKERFLEAAWLLADLRPLRFQMIRAPGQALRW